MPASYHISLSPTPERFRIFFFYLALYMDIYWKCVCQFSSIGSCRHKKWKCALKQHIQGLYTWMEGKIVYMKVNSSYKTWYISESIFSYEIILLNLSPFCLICKVYCRNFLEGILPYFWSHEFQYLVKFRYIREWTWLSKESNICRHPMNNSCIVNASRDFCFLIK